MIELRKLPSDYLKGLRLIENFLNLEGPNRYVNYDNWEALILTAQKFDNIYQFHKWDNHVYLQYRIICDKIDNTITCYDQSEVFEVLTNALEWYYEPFNPLSPRILP